MSRQKQGMAVFADGGREPVGMPHNLEAERSVLAAIIINGQSLTLVQDWLGEADFYEREHRLIYRAAREVARRADASQVDIVTVNEWLDSQGDEQSREATSTALSIAADAFTSANVVAYAEIVVERARLRQLVASAREQLSMAMSPDGMSAAEIASRAGASLAKISPVRVTGLRPYREALRVFADEFTQRHHSGAPVGLPTPWPELNSRIGGLKDADAIVLGARSNMGKTVAAMDLARFTAAAGGTVAVFSLEMAGSSLVSRDVSAVGSVPFAWINGLTDGGSDAETYWTKTTEAIRTLRDYPILLDTDPGLTAEQIVARARRAHERQRLRLVIVDHLHEMALPGKQDEVIERGQAVRTLKALAKELNCPVVILAQLNRGGAAAGEKGGDAARPKVMHLRASGAIEEVADLILFLHRPDAYSADDRPGLVEVIIAKGRNIQTGTVVPLRNRYEYQRLEGWEGAPPATQDSENSAPAPRRRSAYYGNGRGTRAGGSDD